MNERLGFLSEISVEERIAFAFACGHEVAHFMEDCGPGEEAHLAISGPE